ncbi:gamma-interferon-inducible protein 16-like isoform X1 [Elephas maximus indicus]|uniref:gamma-interferon-inducible protein 16-like isoform X1 n=1 Tax=Elephas maximus indicus TaxID=99487 RepID=UPI002116A4FD|nr:gamma-interferon-inducible protein 16-like isoform X1 [Elephas maximus indicus]XP_049736843.1 gamma-interferon-inducible protein 16-like isoform X1 [Elephas maximus indicus]
MVNEYKKILLLKGLQPISEYQFNMVKSVLAHDLQLNKKAQYGYNKIQIADLMEDKFPGATCLDILIELFEDIEGLKDLAKTLRHEKIKVEKKIKEKRFPVNNSKQKATSPAIPAPTTSKSLTFERAEETPGGQKRKSTAEENPGTKRIKVSQKQSQPPCPSAASTSVTTGHYPPPQISSSTPTSVSLLERWGKPNRTTDDFKWMKPTQKQIQLPKTSVASTPPTDSGPQTTQEPLPTPFSSSLNKKMKDEITGIHDTKRIKLPQGQYQLPQTLQTISPPLQSLPQTPQMLLLTPSSSFLTQGMKDTVTQTDVKGMKLPQEQCQLQQVLVAITPPAQSALELSPMFVFTPPSNSLSEKPRLKTEPKKASREEGTQMGPKKVMVLKATEPFAFEYREEERRMFHATVATESEFFRVKVFDISLKEKFTPKRVIVIWNYVAFNGFLEVHNVSSVSDLNVDQKMEISSTVFKNANATPKICHLYLQDLGTFVNGVFKVHKKIMKNKCIFYEIQDDTEKMEVMVYGRLTQVKCEEGDECQFICFELALNVDRRQLRSVLHSFLKVIKTKQHTKWPLHPHSSTETRLEPFF